MEPKELQKLIDFIANSGLDEVNIETEQFKISTKRSATVTVAAAPVLAAAPVAQVAPVAAPVASPAVSAPVAPAAPVVANDNYVTIKSPMIGTFYTSSSPDVDAFVAIGSEVSVGQPVCIIEAMKLFNEIESDVNGRIVKVLVNNASPVEFDQPLFLVEPF